MLRNKISARSSPFTNQKYESLFLAGSLVHGWMYGISLPDADGPASDAHMTNRLTLLCTITFAAYTHMGGYPCGQKLMQRRH
jgi:hypothetical protein